MTSQMCLLVAIFATLITSCRAEVDATLIPGSSGANVVETVVEVMKYSCIFSEDRQFLRRLAQIESSDGTDTNTYTGGYNGGIWKVNQTMLEATTSCEPLIRPVCDLIQQKFNINWTKVVWSDLRMPLYSGLAAALYLMVKTRSVTPYVPSDLLGQEQFWLRYYRSSVSDRNFTALASEATSYSCNQPMDLAFIQDSSGSIANADFQLSLEFVAKVIEAMNVPSEVRVASLIYEDTPTVEFFFNSSYSKATVMNAVRNIIRSTGGTATNLALDAARIQLFSEAHGAGPSNTVKRVAVLITDGQSNSPLLTALAADRLRKEAIVTVFSIGVGAYDLDELKAVASSPECSHVYTLRNFLDIQSIISEIQHRTCDAIIHLPPVIGVGFEIKTTNETNNFAATVTNGTGLVVNVTCGIVDVYVSYTNPNPNPAMYAEKYTATDGHPAYLMSQTTADGQPVYLTVIGTRLPETAAGLANCTDFSYKVSVERKDFEVKCCLGQAECVSCQDNWLRQDSYVRQAVCNNNPTEFRNPCSREAFDAGHIMFSYPYDPSMFIHCDYMGNPYITQCPRSETFNSITQTCGYETPGTSSWIHLPDIDNNPCTPENIRAQNLYFAYEPDSHQFIQCNLWGEAFLRDCPVTEVWNQEELTCVAGDNNQGTKAPGTFSNPCTPEAISAGKLFFPYPCDHTRFIHCDTTGTYWVQFCPGGLYYDPNIYVCVGNDPQFGAHGCD